jgi:hypothetical protein
VSIADLWVLYTNGDSGFTEFVRMVTVMKAEEVREARDA